jgi:hypothetical protein
MKPILIAALLAGAVAQPTFAQRLTLSVNPSVVSFPSADPDAVPIVTSAPITVTVRVQQNNRGSWQLTVLAAGDLVSGPSTVDISTVTWTATPAPPFRTGTLSRTVAQPLASGNGNVLPNLVGSLTFRLANSWLYDAGVYTQILTFTLTAP